MAAVISPSLPASSVLDFLHPTLFDMDLPPSYSPSSCAPSYSAEPGPSEQRLEFASRRKQTPDGMLRRMQNGMTVVLLDQDEHAERPIYGRGGLVRGYVDLSNSHTITSVTAALEGRMDITFGEAADSHWTFLNSSYTIWEENGEETCPPVLPLERIFPTSFEDPTDGRERPLPPSYNPKVSSMRGLKVQVEYTLVVRVTRLGLLWNQEKILSLPLTYIPRSRPHRPIVSSPFPFLPTFKSLAEEWRHLNVAMPSTSPLLGEIDCNLLIPEVQIFGKDDTIPFFLQLRAPTATMRALFCPMPTKGHRPLSWQPQAGSSEPKIRVFVRRQVTAMAYGTKVVRSYIIAEGDLRPIPPNGDTPGDELVVDYEGDMKLTPKVKVGGFNAGRFNVLDYIVLSITPAGSHSSLFEEVNLVHGIRIVTDSCTME